MPAIKTKPDYKLELNKKKEDSAHNVLTSIFTAINDKNIDVYARLHVEFDIAAKENTTGSVKESLMYKVTEGDKEEFIIRSGPYPNINGKISVPLDYSGLIKFAKNSSVTFRVRFAEAENLGGENIHFTLTY